MSLDVWQPEAGQSSGINKMLVISLLVHTLVISAMLFSATAPL